MLETGLVGVASYSARGKAYIVALRPFHNGLIMHQLRYADEVKPWSEVPMPDLPELKPAELGLAKQIIQQIAHETFAPEKYKDEVSERMRELIAQKVEGQEITIAPEAPSAKVIDLMEALKASLGMTKDAERKPAAAAALKDVERKAPAAEQAPTTRLPLLGSREGGGDGIWIGALPLAVEGAFLPGVLIVGLLGRQLVVVADLDLALASIHREVVARIIRPHLAPA